MNIDLSLPERNLIKTGLLTRHLFWLKKADKHGLKHELVQEQDCRMLSDDNMNLYKRIITEEQNATQ